MRNFICPNAIIVYMAIQANLANLKARWASIRKSVNFRRSNSKLLRP
jgi:hypothetical protein